MKQNTVTIQLDETITPEAKWRITYLRKAKNAGDVETINHYQLGVIRRIGILFHPYKG